MLLRMETANYMVTIDDDIPGGDEKGKIWVGNDRKRIGRIEFHGLPPERVKYVCHELALKGERAEINHPVS